MRADDARVDHHAADMDEQDIIDLLELQRLTELWIICHNVPVEAADLLRAMADGLEKAGREPMRRCRHYDHGVTRHRD